MTSRHIFNFLILAMPCMALPQSVVKKNNVIVKDANGKTLLHPWAGGLNAPQFSEIDLNGDGTKDLFVFDREGWRVLTFINNGSSGQVDYTYVPEYESAFPDMQEFALAADYNGDGKADLFTHDGLGGIIVYKNTSSSGNLSFSQVVSPYLEAWYNSSVHANLYCSRADVPAIVDVDGDGDLDILSFDNISTSVNYFENFAADSNDMESFKYYLNTSCWGNFTEDALSNQVTLNKPCPKFKSANKHSGSTLLAFDADGDGDKDLLVGDVTYRSMVFLENGGNKFVADMTSQTTSYPSSKVIDVQVFPAAFLLDVNNDGLKDLLVAPNAYNNIENKKGVWYYKNTGTSSSPVFSFIQEDFLQSEMMEFGTGAYPRLVDLNADGLMDLVVGNNGIYNGANNQISKLVLYLNTGSASSPEFSLKDESWGGIDQINLNTVLDIPTYNVSPSFADVNADGFPDLFIGDYNGRIHYFINRPKNGLGDPEFEAADYLNIDVGQDAAPQVFDVDRDGVPDLLIGNKDGKLAYYHNDGNLHKSDFKLVTKELGGVDTKPAMSYYGYSQPMFIFADQGVNLFSGSSNGKVFFYDDVLAHLSSGNFNLIDSAYLDIDVGDRSFVASYDLDQDGFQEFIVGNSAGGLNYFDTEFTVGIESKKSDNHTQLDMSLTKLGHDRFLLETSAPGSCKLNVYNASGQEVMSTTIEGRTEIPAYQWRHGLYLIHLSQGNRHAVEKIITGFE